MTREALACGCWVTSILRQNDGYPEKYRQPPEYYTPIRRSADQADDLAALYLKVAGKRAETVIGLEADGGRTRVAQNW